MCVSRLLQMDVVTMMATKPMQLALYFCTGEVDEQGEWRCGRTRGLGGMIKRGGEVLLSVGGLREHMTLGEE